MPTPTLNDLYDIKGAIEPVIAAVLSTACGITFYPTQGANKGPASAWGEVEFEPGAESLNCMHACPDLVLRARVYADGDLTVRLRVKRGAVGDSAGQTAQMALRKALEGKVRSAMMSGQGLFSVTNLPRHQLNKTTLASYSMQADEEQDQYVSEFSYEAIACIRHDALEAASPAPA